MRSKRRIKRFEFFPPFLGNIICYIWDNIGHKAKDYKTPRHLRPPNQRTKNIHSRKNKRTIRIPHEREQPLKVWRKKEQQGLIRRIEACMASRGTMVHLVFSCRIIDGVAISSEVCVYKYICRGVSF